MTPIISIHEFNLISTSQTFDSLSDNSMSQYPTDYSITLTDLAMCILILIIYNS